MKRICSLLLTVSLLLSLTACGGTAGKSAALTNTALLEMGGEEMVSAGTITEHDGYSLLTIHGLDWSAISSYSDQLFGELNRADLGFHHHENSGYLENAAKETGEESIVSDELRKGTNVYVYRTYYGDTALFFAGETIPGERERWAMAGAPAEELPPIEISVFDGDNVAEYVPVCGSVDLAAADYRGMAAEGPSISFCLPDLTMEQVEDYVQAALDMGYTEEARGDMGDPAHTTFCFDGRLPNQVQLLLHYYDGGLLVHVHAPWYSMPQEDCWRSVMEFVDGVPEYEPGFNEKLMMSWQELCWAEIEHLYPGDQVGRGTGMGSEGYVFWDMVDASQDDYSNCVAQVQGLGFTDSADEGDGLYTACKLIPFEGKDLPLWATVCLREDYMFCAVGLGRVREESYPSP